MGCDYYVKKVLHIYYNDNEYLNVELNRIRGYYNDDGDDDQDEDETMEDYLERVDEYFKYILTPKMKPIVIYENKWFNKLSYKIKYISLIKNEINKKKIRWTDITKVIKVEERQQR